MRLLTCFLPRTPTTRHKINKMVPSRFAPRIAAISATFPNATQFYFYAPISTYKPPASFEPTEKPWAGVNTKKTDSYSWEKQRRQETRTQNVAWYKLAGNTNFLKDLNVCTGELMMIITVYNPRPINDDLNTIALERTPSCFLESRKQGLNKHVCSMNHFSSTASGFEQETAGETGSNFESHFQTNNHLKHLKQDCRLLFRTPTE